MPAVEGKCKHSYKTVGSGRRRRDGMGSSDKVGWLRRAS